MEIINSSVTIDDLCDDSLLHIFSFLQSKDLIRLERVSKRWQTISLMTPKKLTLDLSKSGGTRKILEKHGSKIFSLMFHDEHLVSRYDYITLQTDIQKYCSKVRSLTMYSWDYDIKVLDVQEFPFLKNLKSLQIIGFNQVFDDEKLFGRLIPFLENTNSLKDIWLQDFQRKTFRFNHAKKILQIINFRRNKNLEIERLILGVSKIHNGEDLNVEICDVTSFCLVNLISISNQIRSLSLMRIIHNCFEGDWFKKLSFHNLRKLDCSWVPFVKDNVIKNLVKICPYLEELSLQDCDNITDDGFQHIGTLENLISLEIESFMTSHTLASIAANCVKLEKISCSAVPNICPSKITSIVASLPNLKLFELKGAKNLTKQCLKSVLELVSQRKNNVNLRLKFFDSLPDENALEALGLKPKSSSSDSSTSELFVSLKIGPKAYRSDEYCVNID